MTGTVVEEIIVGGTILAIEHADAGGVTSTVRIDRADPVFDGHYPGFPILPGLYLLEYAHGAVLAARAADRPRLVAVDRVRFLSPVYPGDTVTIAATFSADGDELRCTAKATTLVGPAAEIRMRYALGKDGQP
jgi:3-hydroxyacyl-[acyl-carrier-protein] dehydratase